MSEHTKEPWKVVGPYFGHFYIRNDPAEWNGMGYQHICSVPYEQGVDFFHANARRIVACVNACEGIGTGWLEKNAAMLQSIVEDIQNVSCQLDEARAQRDELLAAAKTVVKGWESLPGNARYTVNEIQKWLSGNMHKCIQTARTAISNAEAKK